MEQPVFLIIQVVDAKIEGEVIVNFIGRLDI